MDLDFGAVLTPDYIHLMVWGALTTLELFVLGWIVAFVLAAFLLAIGVAPFKPLNWLVAAFVGYHRNIPILVQIFVWYFAAPELLPGPLADWVNSHDSGFVLALIALSLYSAAYMCEDMRSGLRALRHDQREAARALGLSYMQSMRDVLLPQAIRNALPALINQSLQLFKGTSLAMAIGVGELTYATREIENETYRTFETFIIATAFYVVLSLGLMALGAWADKRRLRSM